MDQWFAILDRDCRLLFAQAPMLAPLGCLSAAIVDGHLPRWLQDRVETIASVWAEDGPAPHTVSPAPNVELRVFPLKGEACDVIGLALTGALP